VKLDSSGIDQWHTFLGKAGENVANEVTELADGSLVIAGSSNGAVITLSGLPPIIYHSGSPWEMWVVKLDSSGNVQWHTFLGGDGEDRPGQVIESADGGLIIAGNTDTDVPTLNSLVPLIAYSALNDMWVVKLDASGIVKWHTFLGGSGDDGANNVIETVDGGLVVAGWASVDVPTLNSQSPINSYSGTFDMWVVKLDVSGIVQWHTFLGGTGSDGATSIVESVDEGLLVAGSAQPGIVLLSLIPPINVHSGSMSDTWLVKLDSDGIVQWHTLMGSSLGDDVPGEVIELADGSLVIAGYADGNVPSLNSLAPINSYSAQEDMWVVKLDGSGIVQWHTFLGGSGDDQAKSVIESVDGTLVLAGFADANVPALNFLSPIIPYSLDRDMWVVKINSDGTFP